MKSASQATASALGVYAGLIALQHGVFEILQQGATPSGVMINAIGPPCQPEAVWHACLPAMTLLPSFRIAGMLTVAVSLAVMVWAVWFIQRKGGGLILMALSIIALLVGGGFVAPFIGLVAGAAGTRANASLRWWRARSGSPVLQTLAAVWPWPLVTMAIWLPAGWALGALFDQTMLQLSTVLFLVFDIGLPVLAALSSLAHDALRRGLPPSGGRVG
jgi:hypothetical protein